MPLRPCCPSPSPTRCRHPSNTGHFPAADGRWVGLLHHAGHELGLVGMLLLEQSAFCSTSHRPLPCKVPQVRSWEVLLVLVQVESLNSLELEVLLVQLLPCL